MCEQKCSFDVYLYAKWAVAMNAACEVGPAEPGGGDGASGGRAACFWAGGLREPGAARGRALRQDLATPQCLNFNLKPFLLSYYFRSNEGCFVCSCQHVLLLSLECLPDLKSESFCGNMNAFCGDSFFYAPGGSNIIVFVKNARESHI